MEGGGGVADKVELEEEESDESSLHQCEKEVPRILSDPRSRARFNRDEGVRATSTGHGNLGKEVNHRRRYFLQTRVDLPMIYSWPAWLWSAPGRLQKGASIDKYTHIDWDA